MEIVNQIVMKKISEVKPYVRNPRKNDKTVNLLVEIIPKVGFNVPLVIDRNGIIVKGHARYAAILLPPPEKAPAGHGRRSLSESGRYRQPLCGWC